MPILIRIIIQRAAIVIVGFLAFLGIDVDVDIPTEDQIRQTEIMQQEKVGGVLAPNPINERISDIEQNIQNVISEVRKGQEKFRTRVEDKLPVSPLVVDLEDKPELSEILAEATSVVPDIAGTYIDDVVVNIVCVNRVANIIRMTTGSGVIISESGIVLTNAHVANTFLFNDKNSDNYQDCSIRRENIPTYGFNASLIHISSDWVEENLGFFESHNPRGTGEEDYALLAITSNTNPALSLPLGFSYVDINIEEGFVDKGDVVSVAGYPGVNTGVFEVDSNSSLKKATTFIDDVFTFDRTTIDVVSTSPNKVAQKGSSGGGLFKENQLAGITVTTDDIGEGSFINAITSSYINRDFRNDTGQSLRSFIESNPDVLINSFVNGKQDYLKTLILQVL